MIKSKLISYIKSLGAFSILMGRLTKSLPFFYSNMHLVLEQMRIIGVGSLPIVVFVSVFTGAVSAVQAIYQFQGYVPLKFVGTAIGKSVVIELGPVLTSLIVAGRVGASIAAELGTMRVTEQIDALETLALDPVRYLIMPRFYAGTIMLPILVIFSDLVAILGSYVIAVFVYNITPSMYIEGLRMFFRVTDVLTGLLKALIFGMIITTVASYYGFTTSGGAEGVGKATTGAVVTSSVLILIMDYIIASIAF